MTNTEIAQAFQVLYPAGNWGAFYGDASNADEFAKGLLWIGKENPPTWEQILSVKIPKPEQLTVVEKLASVGLSLDDLKAALGI